MPDQIRSDFTNPAGVGLGSGAQAQENEITGNYRGDAVRQINQASLLQDALEEMTESISEDQEKDFSKREVEEGKKSDNLEKILELKDVQDALQKLHDLPPRELKRALRLLLRMKNSNPRQLRDSIKEQFKEPAHQYAALLSFTQLLRKQGAPASAYRCGPSRAGSAVERRGSGNSSGYQHHPDGG